MIYKASATLRVYSDTRSLEDLSAKLGMVSEGGHSRGDSVGRRGTTRSESMWSIERIAAGGSCVANCLHALLDVARHVIDEGLDHDMKADVFLGVFSDNDQLNLDISADLCAGFSALDLDLLISGYVSSAD